MKPNDYDLFNLETLSQQDISPNEVAGALAKDVCKSLDIDLVTIWKLKDDLSCMTCIAFIDIEGKREMMGAVLKKEDFPRYFRAIIENIKIHASDVFQHPELKELVDTYLKPNEVKSLLDYVIYDKYKPTAIICCETTSHYRKWTDEDISKVQMLTVLSSSMTKWH